MDRKLLLSLTLLLAAAPAQAESPEQAEFFEKKVRPLLVAKCQGCHNAKVKTSGLDLSTGAAFLAGGASGALVSKDDPHSSLLLQVTSYEGRLKMPPMGKLKDEEIAILKTWVESGAVWPGATAPAAPAQAAGRQITGEDRSFWSFRPVVRPAVPDVKNAAWAKTPVDRFILAKLEEKGLKPAAPADRLALLRRVTLDLTGLPPTEDEIQAFLADKSPDAWAKVVDRLLASPRYGEKWGRHWLDIARYADSTGNDEDHRYPNAWRYRDYVIEAFNSDMPYDRFVKEQIAGDLMPAEKPGEINRRGIVATGFLAIGAKAIAQQDKKKMLYDVYDEQVDVTTKAIMGVTLACARCHDHKFDPLLTKDYYSMISMFASTRSFKNPDTHVSQLLNVPLVPREQVEAYERHMRIVAGKTTEADDLIDEFQEQQGAPLMKRMADYMVAARRVYQGKEDVEKVAKTSGLDAKRLKKMADYLDPAGEVKVYLEEWHNAKPEQYAEVAAKFQAKFEKQRDEWYGRLHEWRAKFRAQSDEQRAASPLDKPKLEPAKSRFFMDIMMGKGPFAPAVMRRKLMMGEKAETLPLPPGIPAQTASRIRSLRTEAEKLRSAAPPEPDMATAVEEGTPVEQHVFIRGDYNSPGPVAPKAFVTVLAKQQPEKVNGSGRLELAEWMASSDHPLTARVMANRVWYWHFGEGIVRTPDNFGKMGERPTHPELLDWLASEFVSNGWSLKKLHRTILLSNTYQMSSAISDEAFSNDPENRLFSRFPRRRLTVEELRDGLLLADGSIDLTMGGSLQSGTGTDGENSSARLSIRPEVVKRRMVYIPLRRANLPTLLNLFDFGDATTAAGKRTLTTVAPQALFAMNSDFVAERAQALAKLSAEGTTDEAGRVKKLFLRVLNRPPSPAEVDQALSYVSSFAGKFSKRTKDDAWFSLARVLIASNEFMYVD